MAREWEKRTMNVSTFRNAVATAVMFMFVVVAGAVAVSSDAEARTPRRVTLAHPCDIDKNGKKNGSLEPLCLRVWAQDAYTTTLRDGSYTETPAGPTIATELVSEWRSEFRGQLTSREALSTLRNSLRNVREDYTRRDQ
jgi:hypothetical protein